MNCSKSNDHYLRQMDVSLTNLVLKPKSQKVNRPPNAFMIFAREHRKKFAAQNPEQSNKDISKMLGNAWKTVDVKMKEIYFDKARKLDLLHKQKYPNYSYSPRIARMQKMKRAQRRAELKKESAHDDEECNISQTFQQNAEQEYTENDEKWRTDFFKKSPNSEYVPNNPSYFRDSNFFQNKVEGTLLEMPFQQPTQPENSCRSSCSSLCSEHDRHSRFGSEFYCRASSTCGCLNCENFWRERPKPSRLEPFWNTHSRDFKEHYMHSVSQEPEGFASYPSPSYSQYCNPHAPYCVPSFSPNSCNLPDPRIHGQPFHNPMPWQQPPLPWRRSVIEDPYGYQNFNYSQGRNADFRNYKTKVPLCCSPSYTNYPYDSNFEEENKTHASKVDSPNDQAIPSDVPSNLTMAYKTEPLESEIVSELSNSNEECSSDIADADNGSTSVADDTSDENTHE